MEWKHDEIKALRKKLSLSQRQFAERLGVKRLTIARWESGKMKPKKERLAMLEKLANDTNVSSHDTTQDDTNDTNDTKSENVSSNPSVVNQEADNPDSNVTDENVTDQNGLAQTYYETMYKDASGVISLCTITQPAEISVPKILRKDPDQNG